MIKRSYKILLIALLVLLCTAFIFSNSFKNAEQSRADSDVIVEIVEKVAGKIAPDNELDWNYIVRKCAHLFEFFVLGACATLLYFRFNKGHHLTVGLVFLYAIAVAFSDEFIQRFTGRGSSFTDVMIDALGACMGIFFVLLLELLIKRRKNA